MYGNEFAGRTTASGETFDPEALTMAHRTLPFGTRVRVTNLQNQRTVEVVRQLLGNCSLVGYLEVDPAQHFGQHKLSAFFAQHADELPGFVSATAGDDRELWPALKLFFAKDDVQEAVAAPPPTLALGTQPPGGETPWA